MQQQDLDSGCQASRHLRADQAGINIDADVEIMRRARILERHQPGCGKAMRQIGMFYRTFKGKVIFKRDIVDDNVEQAVIALSRNAKALAQLLNWKVAMRIVLGPHLIEMVNNIGNRRGAGDQT